MNGIQIAELLFKYHSHADMLMKFEKEDKDAEENLDDPSAVIYPEENVIELLMELGYPEPDWEGYAKQCEENK